MHIELEIISITIFFFEGTEIKVNNNMDNPMVTQFKIEFPDLKIYNFTQEEYIEYITKKDTSIQFCILLRNLISMHDRILIIPDLHWWDKYNKIKNYVNTFKNTLKKKEYYIITDASPDQSLYDDDDPQRLHGTTYRLGIFIEDYIGNNIIPTSARLLKKYTQKPIKVLTLNGFCYTHSFFTRSSFPYPNNKFTGLFYLFCMIKYAKYIDFNAYYVINIVTKIKTERDILEKIKGFLFNCKKYINPEHEHIPDEIPDEIPNQIPEQFYYINIITKKNAHKIMTSEYFRVNRYKVRFIINIIDIFPLSQLEYDAEILKVNVPFLGTAGLHSLIDCIFKYRKIPICELYTHHRIFIENFHSFDIFDEYFANIYDLCNGRHDVGRPVPLNRITISYAEDVNIDPYYNYTPKINYEGLCNCVNFNNMYDIIIDILKDDYENKMEYLYNYYLEECNLKTNLIKFFEKK